MAKTPVNFAHNTQLAVTAVDIIPDVLNGVTANPSKLSFYNSGTVNRQVTVHIVESAGSIGTANILAKRSIPPNKVWSVGEVQGEELTPGMSMQAVQDAGTDVNANCSGFEFTQ